MHDITPYTGPVLVTLAYLAVYYGSMLNIVRVKVRLNRAYRERGEKFDRYFGQDRELLAADRIQLNMLEHMPLFLVLLWLNAVFVGTSFATAAGAAYTAARALYPFMMGSRVGRMQRASILVATVPSYLALVALAGGLVSALIAG